MPLPVTPPSKPTSGLPKPSEEQLHAAAAMPSLDEIKAMARREEMSKRSSNAKEKPINTKQTSVSHTHEEKIKEGWKKDKNTGKIYKEIPKAEYDSEGRPILHLEDLDLDNLNSEADKYLAHLRVPPNKEEMARLRAEKAARTKASNTAYSKANSSDND